jgi:hypothetical protein
MADIELVIKIPETLKRIADEEDYKSFSHPVWLAILMEVIQNGTPLNEHIDKVFDDFNKCKCGSSYIVIDGEEYRTDIGYAFEGIELFMNYIKGTLSKEKWEE